MSGEQSDGEENHDKDFSVKITKDDLVNNEEEVSNLKQRKHFNKNHK